MQTKTQHQSRQLINKESVISGQGNLSNNDKIVEAEPTPLLPLVSIRPLTIDSSVPCVDCGSPASHVVETARFKKKLCAKHAQSYAQDFVDEARRVATV